MALIRAYLPLLLTVLLAVATGSTIAIVVADDDPSTPDRTIALPGPDRVVAPFDGPDQDRVADDGIIDAPEESVEAASARVEEGADRREPADLPAAVDQAIERNKAELDPLPLAGAFESVPGCKTRLLAGDHSSRNGVRPVWLTWHYAVIPNRPGFGDLDLLFSIFANPARDASSHFGLDAEGNCYYMVPIESKAWTAVNANSFSIGVEIIAMGNEPVLCPGPCMVQARRIAEFVKQRTGIPIRRGSVSTANRCVPGTAGQITHNDHGSCGGGHIDIKPFSIDAFTRELAAPATVLTAAELKIVRAVRHPAGTGHSRRYWRHRLGEALGRIAHGDGHRRPARRKILRRIWIRSTR